MGPLQGVKIIEVGGIGPGPFCAMMLSDMGAEVIRIERKGQAAFTQPKFETNAKIAGEQANGLKWLNLIYEPLPSLPGLA